MTSSGLKRPLDFVEASMVDAMAQQQQQFAATPDNITSKRRCTNFARRQEATHQSTHSAFRDPAQVLGPLADEVASLIRTELSKAGATCSQAHNNINSPACDTNTALGAPMLTIRQTQLICEKLIRDREQKLREEYDKILINKLAEQYDTFVKYTHDHIEQRYKESNSHQASYLS